MKKATIFTGLLLGMASASAQNSSHLCAEAKMASAEAQLFPRSMRSSTSEQYDLHYHKLDLELSNTSTYVKGAVTFRATVTAPLMSEFEFQLHPSLTIDSIRFQGQLVSHTTNGDYKTVALGSPLSQGNDFTAVIYYQGLPTSLPQAAIGSGITNDVSPSWGARVTWTLSQPYSAYEWWPCKQSLRDKIDSLDVWITVDDSLKAGSNGVLQQISTLPGNKARYEWKHRHPIDYYLISAAVGNYIDYSFYANPAGAPAPVLIQNYLYNKPDFISFVTPRIDLTKDYLEYFSELFGLYPFHDEKYGHSAAPLSGGMEHQTMTTQGVFTADIIAHELGHQWFGDYVTCGSWADIALNEGFASYLEYLMTAQFSPNQASSFMNSVHISVMSQPGGSVYVTDTLNVGRLFNGRLTYDKGSAIFHTLRYEVNNDSLYFATLRSYLQQFGNGTALGTDLKNVFESETGLNLNDYFNQWYYGEGYPTFSVRWNHSDGIVYLKVSQTTSMPSVTPLFRTPLDLRIICPAADTVVRVQLTDADTYISFPWAQVTGNLNIVADPANWLLNTTGSIGKDPTLSLDVVEANTAFDIYPNPAEGFFTLSSTNAENESYAIYDSYGRLVQNIQSSAPKTLVDVSRLAKGVYYVKGKTGTRKLICR